MKRIRRASIFRTQNTDICVFRRDFFSSRQKRDIMIVEDSFSTSRKSVETFLLSRLLLELLHIVYRDRLEFTCLIDTIIRDEWSLTLCRDIVFDEDHSFVLRLNRDWWSEIEISFLCRSTFEEIDVTSLIENNDDEWTFNDVSDFNMIIRSSLILLAVSIRKDKEIRCRCLCVCQRCLHCDVWRRSRQKHLDRCKQMYWMIDATTNR